MLGRGDSWLLCRLPKGESFATEHTHASRSMLYDLAKRTWAPELLRLFGVRAGALPEIRPSSGPFGVCAVEHLGAALPVAGIAGDQQAALFGQGCVDPGQAKHTYDTRAVLLLHTRPPRARATHCPPP